MKTRKKRSIIWKCSTEDFKDICQRSLTIGEILKTFNMENHGGNHLTIRQRAQAENVDLTHIKRGLDSNKGKGYISKNRTVSDEKLFCNDSQHGRCVARSRILKDNLIPYCCSECGQPPVWKNKPLSLILDHINGKRQDHRLVNLRFLCPNCNIQTETFGVKNIAYQAANFNV